MKDFFIQIIYYLITNIHIGTFLIAVLTFGITFINFYRNRASIKIEQLHNSSSQLIQPDIIDNRTPDVYWYNDYRVLSDVVITNRSAKPISIIEFVLNDNLKFNSYHKPGKEYKITIKPRRSVDKSTGVTFMGTEKWNTYRVGEQWLKPIIDIPPHTSVRGFLFFHLENEHLVNIGKNKLRIITSRKTFVTNLKLDSFERSLLPLPERIESDRNHIEF